MFQKFEKTKKQQRYKAVAFAAFAVHGDPCCWCVVSDCATSLHAWRARGCVRY